MITQIRGMAQPEMRQFCARVLLHFEEKLRKELHLKGKKELDVSSLGIPALSGLYQFGSQKRRWYDREPILHKAVGGLYAFSLESLGLMGFKLGDTFGLLQIYSIVCRELEEPPVQADMAKICTTALKTGVSEARELLMSIVGKDLYHSLSAQVSEEW